MLNKKPILVKKSQGLFSILRQIRESGQGQVTYNFEEENTFKDLKTGKIEVSSVRKWSQQQPINTALFYTEKGKFEDLDKIIDIFIDTTNDIGAKYFTL